MPLSIFRVRAVSVSTVIVLLDFFALFGVLFFISLYLQSVHGFSPVGAGLRLLPLTIAFAFAGPLGARLVNRFGPWLPITFGLLASSVAIFSFVTLQVDSSYIHLWPPFVLLGLGIGLVVTSATDAIVGDISEDEAGVAGGIQTTSIQLGGVLGTAVCGSILAASVAAALKPALTTRGVPHALIAAVAGEGAIVSQGLAPVPAGAPSEARRRDHRGKPRRLHDGSAHHDARRGIRRPGRRRHGPAPPARPRSCRRGRARAGPASNEMGFLQTPGTSPSRGGPGNDRT